MALPDPKRVLRGSVAAMPTAGGLPINTGGGGTFLRDADVAALAALRRRLLTEREKCDRE